MVTSSFPLASAPPQPPHPVPRPPRSLDDHWKVKRALNYTTVFPLNSSTSMFIKEIYKVTERL